MQGLIGRLVFYAKHDVSEEGWQLGKSGERVVVVSVFELAGRAQVGADGAAFQTGSARLQLVRCDSRATWRLGESWCWGARSGRHFWLCQGYVSDI